MVEFFKNSMFAKILYYFKSIFASNKFSKFSNYWKADRQVIKHQGQVHMVKTPNLNWASIK